MIVSFADPHQGHHGGIYQAGNWIYTGTTAKGKEYWYKGRKLHSRQVSEKGWNIQQGVKRITQKPSECDIVETPGKHRYIMPLDKTMRVSIATLAKTYPKRPDSVIGNTPSVQDGTSGSNPTSGLKKARV